MNPTKFVIVDPEIDGDTTGPDGWPDAWTRNRAGRVAHTADIVKARRWRDSLNKDIDQSDRPLNQPQPQPQPQPLET